MRILEKLTALIFFIMLLPVFIIIGLMIFITEPFKPIFYKGVRIGKFGRRFIMYKFRTLKIGAEKMVNSKLLDKNLGLETFIGKVIRYSKLDELPQLINIIKGEMSFIGPRPVRPIRFYKNLLRIDDYEKRFLVNPGMSGIAQVEGDYYSLPEEKLVWDLFWIKNISFSLYITYLFKTIFMIGERVFGKISFPFRKALPWAGFAFLLFSNLL
jgi:lipopolysaccharide/colanic/teichoic acid biosynthesis glycosyltransferase